VLLLLEVSIIGAYQQCSVLADRTNGRAYRASVICRRPSVTLCIVAKRCVLEQKLLLTAHRESYMRNRFE